MLAKLKNIFLSKTFTLKKFRWFLLMFGYLILCPNKW